MSKSNDNQIGNQVGGNPIGDNGSNPKGGNGDNPMSGKSHLDNFIRYLKVRFDLREDSAPQEEVTEHVRKGVVFKGTNLWVLIFAILIASLGLNVNSTAVIIGAMLISPLMGPLIGIGFSLGTNDFDLMKNSLRNFLLMVSVSIITSTLYFLISPITVAQSELLARTTPTTYDVLIALFGGLAGMVAQTRKDRSYVVVAGVAIATALMPPLCTAGYGIATGQFRYFIGAFYLFFINSLFISLASYAIVMLLHYQKKTQLNKESEKRVRNAMYAVVLVTIVPSVVLAYGIIQRTAFEENADRYVNSVFHYNNTMLLDYQKNYHNDKRNSEIVVRLVGEPLSQSAIDNARSQLENYGLKNTELTIRQTDTQGEQIDVTALQKSYTELLEEKNAQIARLQSRVATLTVPDTLSLSDISREAAAITDSIASLSLSKHITYSVEGAPVDTVFYCFVEPADSATVDVARLGEWLKVRIKTSDLEVIVRNE